MEGFLRFSEDKCSKALKTQQPCCVRRALTHKPAIFWSITITATELDSNADLQRAQ